MSCSSCVVSIGKSILELCCMNPVLLTVWLCQISMSVSEARSWQTALIITWQPDTGDSSNKTHSNFTITNLEKSGNHRKIKTFMVFLIVAPQDDTVIKGWTNHFTFCLMLKHLIGETNVVLSGSSSPISLYKIWGSSRTLNQIYSQSQFIKQSQFLVTDLQTHGSITHQQQAAAVYIWVSRKWPQCYLISWHYCLTLLVTE